MAGLGEHSLPRRYSWDPDEDAGGWGGENTDITAGKGGILGGPVLPLGIFLVENAQISFDDFIVLTLSSV